MKELRKFIKDQLSVWPMAAANFRSLKGCSVKTLHVGGLDVKVQFNPCRIASTTAETDPDTIASRPCFLCVENRPREQFHLKFEGKKGRRYNIQVNPFPIFPDHLVIAREEHIPQAIWHHLPDMLEFVRHYQSFTIFYNGPMSGASAPDHLHFQACPRLMMPLECAVDVFLNSNPVPLVTLKDAGLYLYDGFTTGVFALKSQTPKSLTKLFYRLLECSDTIPGESEPRFNLFAWYVPGNPRAESGRSQGEYRAIAVLRTEIRSHHYFSKGEDHLTMSPGAADMCGMFVAPHKEDFEKCSSVLLEEMLAEVSVSKETERHIIHRLTRKSPLVDVCVSRAPRISFEIISDGAGVQQVSFCEGKISYNGVLYDELFFDGITRSTMFARPSFYVYDDGTGSRNSYAGALKFIVDGDSLLAINHITLENCLIGILDAKGVADRDSAVKTRRTLKRALMENGGTRKYDFDAGTAGLEYCGRGENVSAELLKTIDESWGQE